MAAPRLSKGGSNKENVRVVCRVRPPNAKEISSGKTCVSIRQNSIEVALDDGNQTFQLDRIFGADSTQQGVFESTALDLIGDVLEGYNATIFACKWAIHFSLKYHIVTLFLILGGHIVFASAGTQQCRWTDRLVLGLGRAHSQHHH